MNKQPLKLNGKNLQEIEQFLAVNPKVEIIREYKALQGIEVGDVLVRYSKRSGTTARTAEIVSNSCPITTKYQVVFLDSEGTIWLKQICVKGGLARNLINPLIHADSWHYAVDPRQLDSVLLGIEYDPRAEYKEFRKNNPGYGGGKHESEEQ
jgi:hypothetical protein